MSKLINQHGQPLQVGDTVQVKTPTRKSGRRQYYKSTRGRVLGTAGGNVMVQPEKGSSVIVREDDEQVLIWLG